LIKARLGNFKTSHVNRSALLQSRSLIRGHLCRGRRNANYYNPKPLSQRQYLNPRKWHLIWLHMRPETYGGSQSISLWGAPGRLTTHVSLPTCGDVVRCCWSV